jgi:radical SAM superfamily enzyme YgiQ (UPF0313 family)
VKILLIQPECQTEVIGFRLAAMPEPLALEILAASVPDHEVRILDMRIQGDLAGVLKAFAPDMVAVTALTTEVYAAMDVLRTVKRHSREIFTLVGGYHVSLMPEDFFIPEVDAVSIGEGELSFSRLVEAVGRGQDLSAIPSIIYRDRSGRWIPTPLSEEKIDMDRLPLPRRDLTRSCREEYFFLFDKPDSSIVTGRGCPYQCNFCSVWEFYRGKTRQMSPLQVMEEIVAVNTDHITFVDDNFLMNYRRESAIADLIRAHGVHKRYSMECRTDSIVKHPDLVKRWVDVGLYAVLAGLEGCEATLKSVNKKNSLKTNDEAIRILKDNGVIIWGAFIVDPQWGEDDFKRLREYVDAKEITHTQFTVLTPLPGTELYRQRRNELLTSDYSCYDTLHAVTPTRLPRERFYELYAGLYKQTGLGPYYELVSQGKLSIADCRKGKGMLEAMTHWKLYLEKDPVLGRCRDKSQALPSALRQPSPRRQVSA